MNPVPLITDTITALATPAGAGAIALIRISGKNAFSICEKIFRKKNLSTQHVSSFSANTIHYGVIADNDVVIDEVLLSVFKAPASYTGEDMAEISCHGSVYIQQQVLQLFVRHGARLAGPGEFTLRAFLNGKMDLSQAEAVADLISSNSSISHQVAIRQMRGGFSHQLKELRDQLISFASLIELELDFSQEDVEFADRSELKKLVLDIQKVTQRLVDSFSFGNVIRNGIPVVIAGKPNAGKSTLLNALLNEERAIVSEIAGTTRDTIEEEIVFDGILFRFIDTAGIRETADAIESMGVNRTFEKIRQSAIVLYLFDVREMTPNGLAEELAFLREAVKGSGAKILLLANKIDKEDIELLRKEFSLFSGIIFISAKEKINIDKVISELLGAVHTGSVNLNDTIVTNARHVEALAGANEALKQVYDGLCGNIESDLLASDVRVALHHLGTITGEISTDDLLKTIFQKFCIGK
jgi:tRNA modification GTPase